MICVRTFMSLYAWSVVLRSVFVSPRKYTASPRFHGWEIRCWGRNRFSYEQRFSLININWLSLISPGVTRFYELVYSVQYVLGNFLPWFSRQDTSVRLHVTKICHLCLMDLWNVCVLFYRLTCIFVQWPPICLCCWLISSVFAIHWCSRRPFFDAVIPHQTLCPHMQIYEVGRYTALWC